MSFALETRCLWSPSAFESSTAEETSLFPCSLAPPHLQDRDCKHTALDHSQHRWTCVLPPLPTEQRSLFLLIPALSVVSAKYFASSVRI